MLSFLEGRIEEKKPDAVVLNVNGIGFSINISASTYERLPDKGSEVKLYVTEVQAPFSIGISLYGFLTREEQQLFNFFRNELKGVAGKRALEYVNKAMRSISIFRSAVIDKKVKLLTEMFGFKKQTAEKIIHALHEEFKHMKPEAPKISEQTYITALEGLVALGFKESKAKSALQQAIQITPADISPEQLIKVALKYI